MRRNMKFTNVATTMLLCIGASASILNAQTVKDDTTVEAGLNLPNGQKFHTEAGPNMRRATAIVNGQILTGTDVEHRLALFLTINNAQVSEEEKEQLRTQILANLIDEKLQIQEAKASEIDVTSADITRRAERSSQRFFNRPFSELKDYLPTVGSSVESFLGQMQSSIAWDRLIGRNIRVKVSDAEVNSILEKLEADKGKTEYRVGEIYLSFTPETQNEVVENARRIVERLSKGGSFDAFARQFSEASTAAVGGDLGFVRPNQLPQSMAEALASMQSGQIATVPVPGGLSIMLLVDKKQILTTDIRDSVLSLKQMILSVPANTSEADTKVIFDDFNGKVSALKGCGQVEELAAAIKAEVGSNDNYPARQLPPQLQDIMLNLQVGQATPAFSDGRGGFSAFVLCGRDQPKDATLPTFEEVRRPLENQRIERRAQILLRDLRRDAIIEYN